MGRKRDSGVGIGRGERKKRERGLEGEEASSGGDKIGSQGSPILCAPAGPLPLNNRLLRNLLVILL